MYCLCLLGVTAEPFSGSDLLPELHPYRSCKLQSFFDLGSQNVSSVAAFASGLFIAKPFLIIGEERCALKNLSFYSKKQSFGDYRKLKKIHLEFLDDIFFTVHSHLQ